MKPVCRLIAVVVLVFALMAPAASATAGFAVPLTATGYASKVTQARIVLERSAATIGESATAHDVAAQLRGLLPDVTSVKFQEQSVELDNGTLVSMIERLDAASTPAVRREVADALLTQLRSQETALGSAGVAPPGDAAVLKRILADEGIAASPDASHWLRDAINKVMKALLGWVEDLAGNPGAQSSVRVIFYVLLIASALAVAWIIFVVVRRMRGVLARAAGGEDAGSTDAVIAAAEGLPDDALAFADAEAGAGRCREAVRALFGGAARELVDRGIVARTRTRTDGELLADVALARAEALPALTELCSAFEPAWYGHIDPGADGYAAARKTYVGLMATLGGDVG